MRSYWLGAKGGVDDRTLRVAPFLHLRLGVHENIDWDFQGAKLTPEPQLLGVAILDVLLDHQKIQVTVLRHLSTSSRPEQDHPAVRRNVPAETPTGFLDYLLGDHFALEDVRILRWIAGEWPGRTM